MSRAMATGPKTKRANKQLQLAMVKSFGEMMAASHDLNRTYNFYIGSINDGWAEQYTLDAMAIMLDLFATDKPPHEKVMKSAVMHSPKDSTDPLVVAYSGYLHGIEYKFKREVLNQ